MPALGAPPRIALCPRCRHDVLPRLAQPSWHREKHRAAATERESPESKTAERIRLRRERKASRAEAIRKTLRNEGLAAAAKFFLSLKPGTDLSYTPDFNCPDCLKMQQDS